MKIVMTVLALGLILVGCSGKKGNEPDSKMTFSLSTKKINLTGVETAVQPVTGQFTITNISSDSIECYIRESCDWMCADFEKVKIAVSESKTITVSALLTDLAKGQYKDTLDIIDFGAGGVSAQVIVQLTANEDDTYALIVHPVSNAIHQAEYPDGWHCYSINANWYLKCFSNSGNPVKVYHYQTFAAGVLGEVYFNEITVAPGDSLAGTLVFGGCIQAPPPYIGSYTLKVGYKIRGNAFFTTHEFDK